MKNVLLLTLLLFTFSAPAFCAPENGGSEKYRATMKEYIHLVDTAVTEVSFIRAANTFNRIAQAEQKEWLPAYYAAYSYLNAAMATEEIDQIDVYCDQAEVFLATALEIPGADESEILCLASLSYTARIRVEMFARGMSYSAEADKLLIEANTIKNTNPRVAYLQARLVMGRPKQFGGGVKMGLPLLRVAGKKFAAAPHEAESLLPDWGRKRTLEILAATAGK
ncbi:MAG: hypothetical protein ACI81P_000926 [Neolewinella sp.]|jgi:hypothetical protein